MGYGYVIDNIDYINNLISKKENYLRSLEAFLENTISNEIKENEILMSYLNYKPFYDGLYMPNEKVLMKDDIAKYVKEGFIRKDIIRNDIKETLEEISKLELLRNSIIDRFISYGTLSISEVIYILEQFGINYRTINVGNKTLLVPENIVLRKEKTVLGEEIDLMALNVLTGEKEYTVLPMYRKDYDILLGINKLFTNIVREKAKENEIQERKSILESLKVLFKMVPDSVNKEVIPKLIEVYTKNKEGNITFNKDALKYISLELLKEILNNLTEEDIKYASKAYKVKENDRICDIVPALEVYDFKGIPIYNRVGNSVVLNKEILNIMPYEVLSFLDYYIESKCQDETITLDKALVMYKGIER